MNEKKKIIGKELFRWQIKWKENLKEKKKVLITDH